MNRIALLASALALSVTMSACASQSDSETSASADSAVIRVASNETVENAPLPMAIAPASEVSPEDGLVLPVGYACDDGRSFIATYPAHGKSVMIAAAGETLVLPHRGAADTVMFSNGDVTLTAEGAEATLTGIDEPYTACMAG